MGQTWSETEIVGLLMCRLIYNLISPTDCRKNPSYDRFAGDIVSNWESVYLPSIEEMHSKTDVKIIENSMQALISTNIEFVSSSESICENHDAIILNIRYRPGHYFSFMPADAKLGMSLFDFWSSKSPLKPCVAGTGRW